MPPPVQQAFMAVAGIDASLPMVVLGVVAGLMAKYGATYSTGETPGAGMVKGDFLTAPLMAIVAVLIIHEWAATARDPMPLVAQCVLAAGLALAGAKVTQWVRARAENAMDAAGGHHSTPSPPSDAVSPVNTSKAVQNKLKDVRAAPVAQLGSRYGSDARQQAGARGEHDPDQDLIDKLGDE